MAAKTAKTTFGSEVRRLRLLAGMSLRQLARRSGISPVYLSDIENNRKPAPSADILHSLISILHGDYDDLARLAMKSVEEYGGIARKPRFNEQLSTDEYFLIMKKKQVLAPEEFRSWLTMTTVSNTRSERKIKQSIRDIVTTRLTKEQPLELDFESGQAVRPAPKANGIPYISPTGVNGCVTPEQRTVYINHYEGQSEKEAVEIYVDTCYKEWKSMKNEFCRKRYLAGLEHRVYIVRTVSLGAPVLLEHDN